MNSSITFLAFQQSSVHIYLVCRKIRTKEAARATAEPTMLNFLLFIFLTVK